VDWRSDPRRAVGYETKTYPVDSFSRTGDNLTGVSVLASVPEPKRRLLTIQP
jgi:hypothetical protein